MCIKIPDYSDDGKFGTTGYHELGLMMILSCCHPYNLEFSHKGSILKGLYALVEKTCYNPVSIIQSLLLSAVFFPQFHFFLQGQN